MLEEFSTRRELNMEIRFISHSSACSDSKRSLKAITSYQVISTGNGFGLGEKAKGPGRLPAPARCRQVASVVICEVEEAGLISCSGHALTRQ
jgi:hypothetical protein